MLWTLVWRLGKACFNATTGAKRGKKNSETARAHFFNPQSAVGI
jgi:hypothetical protein